MGSFVNNLIYAVLGVNVLAVLLLTTSHFHAETDNTIKGTLIPQVDMSGIKGQYHTYYFDNPTRALRLLEKLDIYETVGSQDIIGAKYNVVASGFKYNNEYCAQHRALIVEKPEIIFEQVNFITNYWLNHRVRNEVMPKFGKNLHPEVHPNNLAIKKKYALEPSLEATIFFMHNIFFYYRQLGKQYSCLTQESNHIPGHDKMAQKDHLGQALVDYAKRYEKRPHCFNFNKYFPKTWLMQNKEQCEDFFKEFNSPIYKQWKKERKVVYFRKIGAHVHEGKGVFPVTDDEEIYIRTVYENGNKCGIIKHNNLLQYNVHNLLLVTNRKFGFRQYMLIASVNPVIAYFHDGYMRRSLNEYDPNNTDKGTFVTNIGINIKQEDIKMTPDEIQEFTSWSLAKFTQYLIEQNIVKDQSWLDTYLRPEFKKVLIHLVRMAQNGFLPKSSVFELYGIDYVMDENLDLWFIEANATPLIHGFTPESTALINKMLEDTFEIVTGLLRSRMKRIVSFINILSKETDGKEIPNFGLRKSQFRNLTKNFFDDEFKPSPGNTFQKIIDDNLIGKDRYSGLIEEECF